MSHLNAAAEAVREAPALALSSAKLIQALDDLRVRAAQSWRKSKSPMAAYQKEVAIIVRHLARFLAR